MLSDPLLRGMADIRQVRIRAGQPVADHTAQGSKPDVIQGGPIMRSKNKRRSAAQRGNLPGRGKAMHAVMRGGGVPDNRRTRTGMTKSFDKPAAVQIGLEQRRYRPGIPKA